MALRDYLWGGGSLEAPSPEATAPVPSESPEQRRSFIRAAGELLNVNSPRHLSSDSIDAERTPLPDDVIHADVVSFFEGARASIRQRQGGISIIGSIEAGDRHFEHGISDEEYRGYLEEAHRLSRIEWLSSIGGAPGEPS